MALALFNLAVPKFNFTVSFNPGFLGPLETNLAHVLIPLTRY